MGQRVLAMTTLNPDGQEALERYLSVVGPLMERAGAKVLSRHETSRTIAGDDLPQFVTLVEYPSADAVRMVFEDLEYKALESVRKQAFSRYDVCIVDA